MALDCSPEINSQSSDNSAKLFSALIVLFDLILYVPSKIFQLNRDDSSWVEPVLS